MKRKTQRMIFVGAGLAILAIAGALAFFAMGDNVRFFYEENMRLGRKTTVYVKTMDCVLDDKEDEIAGIPSRNIGCKRNVV